jgi:hypothetical protein
MAATICFQVCCPLGVHRLHLFFRRQIVSVCCVSQSWLPVLGTPTPTSSSTMGVGHPIARHSVAHDLLTSTTSCSAA